MTKIIVAGFMFLILGGNLWALFTPARAGYGYPGYYGYHRTGSSWYSGSSKTYHAARSVRAGSVTGTNYAGGGPAGGK